MINLLLDSGQGNNEVWETLSGQLTRFEYALLVRKCYHNNIKAPNVDYITMVI